MAGKTEIIDLALTRLGQDAIMDPAEDSVATRTMNAVWAVSRDRVLEDHRWNFAQAEASLPAADPGPTLTDQWQYRYLLPAEPYCLMVREGDVVGGGNRPGEYPWKQLGRFIYTDNPPPLKLTYTYRVEDEEAFSAVFVECLALLLASHAAVKLTGGERLSARLENRYLDALPAARSIDSHAESDQALPECRSIQVRR